ncbi:uncharacterized protein LOC143880791 [Tasmannia lanceolata]|uniref:uncharacterized protein LOC143880791 n=1 Tax=Tasmannia lanceolata TaxID=3420 RepID=UPI004064057C
MIPPSDFMKIMEPKRKEDSSSKLSVAKASFPHELEENPPLNNKIRKPSLVDGKLQIIFDPGRIQSSLQKWKNSLIGKIYCTQIPHLEYIQEKILLIWNPRGDLSIKFWGNDFLLFTFQREDDLFNALTRGPYYIFQTQILVLQRWNPEFNPFSDKIHKIPIWVWFPKLPVYLWEEYYLFSLAETIGKPLKMDDCSIERGRARVCVEIDCSSPVPDGVWIGPKDTGNWQPIEYEILPILCSVCDQLGHDGLNSSCPSMEKSTMKTSCGFENHKRKQHVTCIEIGSSDDDDDDGFGIVRSCKRSERRGSLSGKDNHSNKAFPTGDGTETREPLNELSGDANDQSHEAFPNETGKVVNEAKQSSRAGKEQAHNKDEAVNGTLGSKDKRENEAKQSSRKGKEQAGKCKENGKERLVDRNFNYHAPEFHDFDKEREEIKFEVGQIWAVFDDGDCMPRYYVYVRKVFSPGFRVRINWLFPNLNPKNHDEIDWLDKGLPIACGNFKLGVTEETEKRLMFSHLVSCEKDRARNACRIYPRKGDVWAIFKDWSFKWSSESNKHVQYEYEYVQVLSDYAEDTGVKIVHLVKVSGFVSLFQCKANKELNSVQVSSTELFRFSHMIPYYRMTGQEREDILNGSFELDPASLPHIIEEKHVDAGKSSSSDAVQSHNSSVAMCSGGINSYLEPSFHKFEADKSIDKFQPGQIWALYSDVDGMPKYYALIKKIGLADSEMQVTGLDHCPESEEEMQWFKKDLPICCGTFKLRSGKNMTVEIGMFSHVVQAEPLYEKKNTYEIYPRKGEVWALNKNWSPGADLNNCEYEMVEILKDTGSALRVLVLGKVDGYESVFKGFGLKKDMSWDELFRFSHQVSSFKLIEECSGKLRGYLELDPASLPLCIAENHLGAGKTSSNDSTRSHNSSPTLSLREIHRYPEPEFHNFEADTPKDEFRQGQIWALYNDIDGMPKYYAQIKRVCLANSEMQVAWLEPCPVTEEEIRWFEEDLPICCGTFKLQRGKTITFAIETFSHVVHAEPVSKSTYKISPRKGEVWAVYKNWSTGGALPDLENFEYEMVEVLKDTGSGLRVSVLEKVDGYKSVFKGIGLEKDIPPNELLRFSHQVSAFRLTKECSGNLRGYLELNPASVPTIFFHKTSNLKRERM